MASRRLQAVRLALLVGELDHQDAVLGDEADQRDQPDLAVDVERAEADVERQDGAEDRQRHRHQDDERVAEALELGGEHQVDHEDRQREGDGDGVALLHLEARLVGVVDEEALGQRLLQDALDLGEAVAGGDAGQRQRRDGGGVELVELLDGGGGAAGLDADHGGERHHLAGGGADEELAERLGVVAERRGTWVMMS